MSWTSGSFNYGREWQLSQLSFLKTLLFLLRPVIPAAGVQAQCRPRNIRNRGDNSRSDKHIEKGGILKIWIWQPPLQMRPDSLVPGPTAAGPPMAV